MGSFTVAWKKPCNFLLGRLQKVLMVVLVERSFVLCSHDLPLAGIIIVSLRLFLVLACWVALFCDTFAAFSCWQREGPGSGRL